MRLDAKRGHLTCSASDAAGRITLLALRPDDNMQDLINGVPAGVSASEGQTLVVPQGIVVRRAAA